MLRKSRKDKTVAWWCKQKQWRDKVVALTSPLYQLQEFAYPDYKKFSLIYTYKGYVQNWIIHANHQALKFGLSFKNILNVLTFKRNLASYTTWIRQVMKGPFTKIRLDCTGYCNSNASHLYFVYLFWMRYLAWLITLSCSRQTAGQYLQTSHGN
jgi:hypothetical protein